MEVSLGANKASYGNDKNFRNEEFYSPICLSGYLTPLQRKKLREERNLLFEDVLDSHSAKLTNAKKLLGNKRKKGNTSNVTSKKRLKVKKSKELIPQIQCQVSRIVLKASNSNEKDRKFFKTSSLSRLEKANFTLSLEFKKSVLNIGKCVEPASYAGKRFVKECTKVIESSNDSTRTVEIGKENSPEDCSSFTSDVSFDSESGPVSDSSRERSVFDFDWPSDEDLVRRQERARASLRSLNDSRKSVIPEKENKVEEEPSLDRKQGKLYPIFYFSAKQELKNNKDVKRSPKSATRRLLDTSKGDEQRIIDAGQKEVGAKTCSRCNMVYTVGRKEDEVLHSDYHHMYLTSLKFNGWKEENVIGEYGDGRVIMVREVDKGAKLKKIEDILVIANRDLGFSTPTVSMKPEYTFVLFISNAKQVAGCLIAEPISSACPVLLSAPSYQDNERAAKSENWCLSSEKVPAICGVNRIWVTHSYRRRRIASRMLDCLRCHFLHGHVVGIRELAFTDPAPDGRALAAAYTGTDHFLVYR